MEFIYLVKKKNSVASNLFNYKLKKIKLKILLALQDQAIYKFEVLATLFYSPPLDFDDAVSPPYRCCSCL
jgi:hypothetical protein